MSYFFFLYGSPSLSLCMALDSISSNIDEALSINPFTYVTVFGDFNIHHKNWLTYLGGTDRLVNSVITLLRLCYDFTQIVNFLFRISDCDSTVQFFWILCSTFSFCWEILIMWLSQFSLTFRQIQNEMPYFTK